MPKDTEGQMKIPGSESGKVSAMEEAMDAYVKTEGKIKDLRTVKKESKAYIEELMKALGYTSGKAVHYAGKKWVREMKLKIQPESDADDDKDEDAPKLPKGKKAAAPDDSEGEGFEPKSAAAS